LFIISTLQVWIINTSIESAMKIEKEIAQRKRKERENFTDI